MGFANYESFREEVFSLDRKIRYIGIFHKNQTYMRMRDGVENYMSPEATINSLTDTVRRWKMRQSLYHKIGKPLYAMAEYEKLKRITIPFNSDGVILISCEPELYHEIITKEIIDIRDRVLQPKLEIKKPVNIRKMDLQN